MTQKDAKLRKKTLKDAINRKKRHNKPQKKTLKDTNRCKSPQKHAKHAKRR